MARVISLLAALCLAGCTLTTSKTEDPRKVWCEFNSPRKDATPETPRKELDEINAHNAQGAAWCGWKPGT